MRRNASIWPGIAIVVLCLFGVAAPVAAQQDCTAAPPHVISMTYVSRYDDDESARATLDEDREVEVESALAPLDGFIDELADQTEGLYVGSIKERTNVADCIVARLGEWADADALSDLGTETVQLTIGARLAGFALVLWQTTPYTADDPRRAVVLDWLGRRMRAQIDFWADAPGRSQQGNLRAWAALAAAAISVHSDAADMRDWAAESLDEVMCSASVDGSLPQEMRRGKFGLHYQLHAIAPLVTTALLLERQQIPATEICEGALHRIVEFAASDLIDGAKSAEITGVEQSFFDGTQELTAYQLAWIEQYLLLRKNPTLEALAEGLRPLIYTKLGGNQTELWGR